MNDPGLDEPISNNAKDFENGPYEDDSNNDEAEDDQAFLKPR